MNKFDWISSSTFKNIKSQISPSLWTGRGLVGGVLSLIMFTYLESVDWLQIQWRKRPLPIQLFLLLCLNLLIAPAVQAATGLEISRFQAYALGVLGLTTLGLSVYLFVVIFQPERF